VNFKQKMDMNKNVLAVLAACAIVACLAFSGETPHVCTPAVPKQVIVEHFLLEGKAQDYVNQKLSEGWVLKTWTVDKLHFVIMEKY
jgi:hypothetical protein